MKTTEYFRQLQKSEKNDNVQPEAYAFTAMWVRSNMPEVYAEVTSRYKHLESEIMHQHYSNDNKTDF